MRAVLPSRTLLAVTSVFLMGCLAPSPDLASEEMTGPAIWYRRARPLDLTGEGEPDSVRIEAHGDRPDSLQIALVLEVEGEERFREEWGSSYELALVDSAVRVGPRLDEFMRARLDTVLTGVRVQPLDEPSVRLLAEDSAALAGLVPRPENRTSISYGYETTLRLVWDAPRTRFVRLWSCC